MSEQKNKSIMQASRRRFLRSLAAMGGSVAVPLGFSSVANALTTGSNTKLHIGVALPAFGNDGTATTSLINGLQLGLASTPNARLEITHKGSVLSRVKKLSQSGADLIIGAVTPRVAHQIGVALRGSNTVFLNVEPGAQMQHAKDMQSNVFHHTLQLWQAHYATGVAATARGNRAAVLSSFHESGYDGSAAFIAGFESAGGMLVSQAVYRADDKSNTLLQTVAALQQSQPNFIYVNASGERGKELMQAVGANVVPAPFAQDSGSSNSRFALHYEQATGHTADAYALLGYEAGQLLTATAGQMAEQHLSVREALTKASFTGPRGLVKMQPEIQATTAATYVNARGNILNNLTAVADDQARNHAGWTQAVSGWSLPYGVDSEQRRA